MRVILLERIEKLGFIGDEVNVKDGFARNFLLPNGKALRSTAANLEYFASRKAEIETQNLHLKTDAEKLKEKMKDVSLVIVRQASESGMLFGSVRAIDICKSLKEVGFSVDKSQIRIASPIKTIGNHIVQIVLHAEVALDIPVRIITAQELQSNDADVEQDEEESSVVS